MAIKIVLLTQWFDPEPTFKGLAFARELVRRGFAVEVITGFPNYPGGKLYDGYRIRLIQSEMMDGVEITRLPLYPSHDGSAFRRILNYTSFAVSSLVYGIFFLKRANVIYAYHPPLTVGITASLLRLIRKIPVVYDIQDMWPDTLQATGMIKNQGILKIISSICDWVYRRVDRIVVLSPGFKKLLEARGVHADKLSLIYNWCDETALMAPQKALQDPCLNHSFVILFAGNMGKAQGLETIIKAAELVNKQGANIQFIMLGSGIEVGRLKSLAASKNLSNVKFISRVKMDQVRSYLDAADALLVHLRKDPLFEITIPSKTQAYMVSGKPILMAVNGDASDLIRNSRCGVTSPSDSPQAIAEAALLLFSSSFEDLRLMGDRGKAYYLEHMSLNVGVNKFAKIFKELARDQ